MAKRRPPPDDDDSFAEDTPLGSDSDLGPLSDRVKFPFGETTSGARDPLASDSGSDEELFGDSGELLEDSDLDAIADAGSSDSLSEPFGSSAELLPRPARSKRRANLPSMPPDASPGDDASFETLEPYESGEESLVDLGEDSHELAARDDVTELGRVSDLGPISPSGPLIIVEDDEVPGASTRYQASIVDDSARLAGSASQRRPKRRRGPGRSRRAQRSWREEALDESGVDVPTLSGRQGLRGEEDEEELRPSRKPLILLGVLLVAALAGLAGLESTRRAQLASLRAELAQTQQRLSELEQGLPAQLAAARQAGAKEGAEQVQQAAQRELAEARAQAAREARAAEARGRAAGEAAARQQAAQEREAAVRQAVERERAKAEREARESVRAELARLEGDQESAIAARVDAARGEERERARAARAEALRAAEDRHREELAQLRRELAEELAAGGGGSRSEDEELAAALERDRKEALDEQEGGGSASAGEGLDAWEDEFFGEGGGSESASSGGDTSDEDLDALFADAEEGGEAAGFGDEEDSGEGLVDRAWGWVSENIHGSVGYKNLSHFSHGSEGNARKTRHELRFYLDYRGWLWQNETGSTGVRVVTELDVRVDDDDYTIGVPDSIDDDDRRRPILTTKDFYAALAIDLFEIRVGYQIFGWGTGDLFNPTDNLNPIDFSDPFDSRRIPVFSTAITLDFNQVSFELVSIPTFTRSRLPLRNRRFDPLRASPLPVLNPTDPEADFSNAQWGGRMRAHVGGFDLSLSGFSGFNDLPSARLAVIQTPTPAIVIDPAYEKIHVAGFDFATTLGVLGASGKLGEVLGGIQLHGEVAHFFTEGSRAEDFVQFVIGFNYQFVDLLWEHDLQVVVEFGSDYVTKEAEDAIEQANALDRIFKNAVLVRLQYDIGADIQISVTGGVILHGDENGYVHPAISYNASDNLQFELAGDVFLGGEDTFFGQFKNDGRVIFEARWRW